MNFVMLERYFIVSWILGYSSWKWVLVRLLQLVMSPCHGFLLLRTHSWGGGLSAKKKKKSAARGSKRTTVASSRRAFFFPRCFPRCALRPAPWLTERLEVAEIKPNLESLDHYSQSSGTRQKVYHPYYNNMCCQSINRQHSQRSRDFEF